MQDATNPAGFLNETLKERNTVSFHHTLARMAKKKFFLTTISNFSKDMKQLDLLDIVGGNTKWYSHFAKTAWYSDKVKHSLSIYSAVQLLGIYAK